MNKDLTTGKPEKVLWQFCLPLFGSIIFQQLYNIADSFVAGKFISDNALAAVGNSYEITLIFIAFAFGCNIACSVLAALFFGAKQYNDLKTTVYTALISSCVICAVLMLVGTLCCDSLLRLIKTPEEVFADSKLYLDIFKQQTQRTASQAETGKSKASRHRQRRSGRSHPRSHGCAGGRAGFPRRLRCGVVRCAC